MEPEQFMVEFPPSINNFSQSEYLAIFWGLLFAFVVAEYVIFCGKMLKHHRRITPHWEFLIWVFVLLIDFIFTWYFNWLRMEYINKIIITRENWTVENGILTPTLKIKRKVLDERYSKIMEAWYEPNSDDPIVWEEERV